MESNIAEFLRDRKDNEDWFISDRIHNALQYTFHCEDTNLVEMIINYLRKFWNLKENIVTLLEEECVNYDGYEEKALQLATVIDNFDSLLVVILLNIIRLSPDVNLNRNDVTEEYLKNNNF